MASGTAYRWNEPARDVVNLYTSPHPRKAAVKLYKAPHKVSKAKAKLPSTPLISQLPIELLHQVLLELDILSLGMLRRVNTTTRTLVESFPAYSLLRKHASYTLRVMDATKCTSHFPICWLFTELCHSYYRTCTDFGPFLYLPTITRLCFECSLTQPEYQVAPTPDIKFHFGLSEKDIRSLPVIHGFRNRHARKPSRRRMVDVAQAKALGIKRHGGSVRKMNKGFRERLEAHRKNCNLKLAKYHADTDRGYPCRFPVYKSIPRDLVNGLEASSWKLWATTSFPYLDRWARKLEPGFYCRACTYHWEEKKAGYSRPPVTELPHSPSQKAYYRAFLEADLPGHFLRCPAVKKDYNFRKRDEYISWPFKRDGTDFIVDANGASAGREVIENTFKNDR